jgi:hypothetical protein
MRQYLSSSLPPSSCLRQVSLFPILHKPLPLISFFPVSSFCYFAVYPFLVSLLQCSLHFCLFVLYFIYFARPFSLTSCFSGLFFLNRTQPPLGTCPSLVPFSYYFIFISPIDIRVLYLFILFLFLFLYLVFLFFK